MRYYFNLARGEEGVKFYHAPVDLMKKLLPEASKEGNVVMMREHDKENIVLQRLNNSEFAHFIRVHKKQHVYKCDHKSYMKFMGAQKKNNLTAFLLMRNEDMPNVTGLDAEFNILAAYKDIHEVIYITTDLKKDSCSKIKEMYNISLTELPKMWVIVAQKATITIYPYNRTEFKSDPMISFWEDWRKGRAYKIGEDMPVDNNGPVKKIVQKNFADEVIVSGKNVLLKFYSPTCGHCKNFEPVFIELAKEFEDVPNIKFAECDATKNTIANNPISSYPTLKLFLKKNPDKPILFEGNRTKDGIKAFLAKYGIKKRKVDL
jgi:protein disulfide-isomerase-like protein